MDTAVVALSGHCAIALDSPVKELSIQLGSQRTWMRDEGHIADVMEKDVYHMRGVVRAANAHQHVVGGHEHPLPHLSVVIGPIKAVQSVAPLSSRHVLDPRCVRVRCGVSVVS